MTNAQTVPAITETPEQEIARLRKENEELKAATKPEAKKTFKVGEKGGISVYGLGMFPITLYRSQWDKLISMIPDLQAFIEANKQHLTEKPVKVKEVKAA